MTRPATGAGAAAPAARPVAPGSAGNVYVEALLVIPIILLLITGIAQLTLLWTAQLGVMHAANAAARAAIVVLDDDPRLYGGEARNAAPDGSARHAEITRAAMIALVGAGTELLAPDPDITFERALVRRDLSLPLPELLTPPAELAQAVKVSFPNHAGTFGLREIVTVRVEHTFSCLVPIARYVVCGVGSQLPLAADAGLPNQGAPYIYQGPLLGAWLGEGGR